MRPTISRPRNSMMKALLLVVLVLRTGLPMLPSMNGMRSMEMLALLSRSLRNNSSAGNIRMRTGIEFSK